MRRCIMKSPKDIHDLAAAHCRLFVHCMKSAPPLDQLHTSIFNMRCSQHGERHEGPGEIIRLTCQYIFSFNKICQLFFIENARHKKHLLTMKKINLTICRIQYTDMSVYCSKESFPDIFGRYPHTSIRELLLQEMNTLNLFMSGQ